MLRDVPNPYQSPDEASVFMNATDPDAIERTSTPQDPLDDVFGSAPSSPAADGRDASHHTLGDERRRAPFDPSDIPRLRSTHVTNGYREGVAVSKERHLQQGFDEGYTLGAELGLKAGWCLGALDGILCALSPDQHGRLSHPVLDAAGRDSRVDIALRECVGQVLERAKLELRAEDLFGEKFFGADGVWIFDVPGPDRKDAAEDPTFSAVARSHPLVIKWTDIVQALALDLDLSLE